MIFVTEDGRLRLVTQPDHAVFAAELLSLFRLPELLDHPRRNDLLRAIRLHDNGWRELDAAPRVNPSSGLPYSFLDLPDHLRLEIWERGTARYAERDPYAALLITEHALSLYRANGGQSGWRELLARLTERRDELLGRCGLTAPGLAAGYRFVELADCLSLAVCAGWSQPFEAQGLTGELRGGALALSPFPLAGATTFDVPCRWIETRRYTGDADLAGTLAEARWSTFPVRVVPG